MKSHPHPHTLDDVDLELEEAIDAFRRLCARVTDGRVNVEVERFHGVVVDHHVGSSRERTVEIERVMRERPHKDKTGMGRR
jgi:hypothetical protein